jgi:hypothetical protein
MAKGLPHLKPLVLITGLLVWFGSSVETKQSAALQTVAHDPRVLLAKPLLALGAMVARNGDDRLYFNYADLMLGHAADFDYLAHKEQGDPAAAQARLRQSITPDGRARLPYRDFPVEYPPVPLALMLLPRLLVSDYAGYRIVFSACTGALFLLTVWLATRLVAASRPPNLDSAQAVVWRRSAWLLLAIGPILCQRFDILPAALVAAGLVAVAERRDRWAGVAFGLATMTKLYPLLLCLPLGAFYLGAGERRRTGIIAGAAAITVMVLAAPFLATVPATFLRSTCLYGARPFHFESTWGSLLLTALGPGAAVSSFGSRNVMAPPWLLQLSTATLVAGLAAIARAAWRNGRALGGAPRAQKVEAMSLWALATLLFVLAASKVLSPQFLIWLLPLVVVMPGHAGRRVFWLAFAAAGLTQIFYPALYDQAAEGHALGLGVLLARNLVLLALMGWVLRLARRQSFAAAASAELAALAPIVAG